MRTLFLDLASHQGCLALVEGDRVVASVPVDHRIGDAELMPLFQSLLSNAGRETGDIERIACVSGPGGFTSLRVAAAFANALSYSLDVPASAVHLSDLYAARAGNDFLWLHSTKKNELFARGFGTFSEKFPEASLFEVDQFVSKVPKRFLWTGELLPAHEEAVAKKGGTKGELKPLEEVLPAILNALPYKKETVKPWYGRSW
jgi:tRNA threonylcarbamoyl adenosine modification protein YeaZ